MSLSWVTPGSRARFTVRRPRYCGLKGLEMRARVLRIGLALATAAAVIGVIVPSASAGLLSGIVNLVLPPCGTTTHPFSALGDNNAYCAFANSGFENGSNGWTLSGDASVVSGNEPWDVAGGTNSLDLAPGASAASTPLPISLLDPYVRFFAQSDGASGSLQVQVVFHGILGNLTGLLNYGSLTPGDYQSWQLTDRMRSWLALPVFTSSAQIIVTNTSRSGDWQVDDFYLDPCVSRFGG